MAHESVRRLAAMATGCLLLALPACGQQAASNEVGPLAASKAQTEAALALLQRTSEFLTRQSAFQFELEEGHDTVQPSGLVLEFGARRVVTVRRPDRLRVEERRRNGHDSTLFFDGKMLSVYFPSERAYVSLEKPGTLEQMLDYVVNDLGETAPLSDILRRDFYDFVAGDIEYGLVVGKSRIEGRRCDHVLFTSKDVDAQLWIEGGARPLPWRVVFSYKTAPGSPQFRARFLSWDLDPDVADPVFDFSPPVAAERLSVGDLADPEQSEGGE